jgi:hypothetical protein
MSTLPLGPCPIRSGTPPGEQWAPLGTPPDTFTFMGAVPTRRCWMVPCPCCGTGWVLVVPDGTDYGYGLAAEVGCNAGCAPPEIAWWHLLRLGERPPPEPPDERAKRYAAGAIRRILATLPERPSMTELRRAAFTAGGWLEAGQLRAGPIAAALLGAARRAGLEPASLVPELAAAVLAGRARPGRTPG